jgi:hypothetical protein
MKPSIKKLFSTLLLIAIFGSVTTTASAALISEKKASPNQILLDTGGGGGEGSALPGVKWTFAETPQGKPFIFWTWSATD